MYSSGVSFVPDKKAEVSYTRTDHIHEKYPQPKNYGGFLGAIYKELYWMTRYVWHIICFEWEGKEKFYLFILSFTSLSIIAF